MTCCDYKPTAYQFHCVNCCETFGTLALFDQHQVVRYSPPVGLRCRDPAKLRGVIRDEHGVWRTGEDFESIQRRISAMKEAREARIREL